MHRNIIMITCALILYTFAPALGQEKPQVKMETSKGTVVIELYGQKAPMTTANFLAYVRNGFYEGTIFHRVIRNFMVQGGGFTEEMKQKPNRPPIRNEADNGLKNNTGTIAMARTNAPHSATSQFFINVKDNHFLNHRSKSGPGWGYCVFGRVIKGMEVVRAIENSSTAAKGNHGDVPVKPILIERMTVIDMVGTAGPGQTKQ